MDALIITPAFSGVYLFITLIFGLCIGSFLNVVITRLPGMIDRKADSDRRNKVPNLISPGSHCPQCKHKINWYDNIPVISYLILKGRCRHCGYRIPVQYLWVELLTGLLFALCYFRFGLSITFFWSLVLTSMLLALAMIDINSWLLPDSITLPGIVLGLVCNLFEHFAGFTDALLGAVSGYLVLWLIYQIHYRLTGREGLGYGDFKLLAMLGAWLGWYALPIILLISSLAGLIIFLILKLAYQFDHTQPLPFGPFLALAGWVYLMNHSLINLLLTA